GDKCPLCTSSLKSGEAHAHIAGTRAELEAAEKEVEALMDERLEAKTAIERAEVAVDTAEEELENQVGLAEGRAEIRAEIERAKGAKQRAKDKLAAAKVAQARAA